MLDSLTSQLSPAHRNLADRSIAATAGALFGVVLASTVALLTGRPPFSLDPSMLMLYGSAIPLSIAGFMMAFSREAPKLPMLATLQFLAIFIPGIFFTEVVLSAGELHIGGLEFAARDFVGFRAIVVAAFSGVFFSAIKADGTVGDATRALEPSVNWQKRHDEAVERLAMVDVDARRQQADERRALAAFDRELQRYIAQAEAEEAREPAEEQDEWMLELERELAVSST